ncbi:hypothetical protein CHS0354_015520 [Potamilus streckersoni]|uniref:Microsomal glutathione S-transferase 1 n=1 Tax=Potamilus streckersoni TaxID=2493646 RepID=A0AAE0SEG1_9BIVA|nr:hypothetical protein CHS0354_015520 [Potamilus streckersoni]
MAGATLSLDNPIFAQFLFYAGVVLIKTCLMSLLTARYRHKNKAFLTDEDCQSLKRRTGVDVKPSKNDPDVERVRGCHQNDLENVIPFVLLGLLYSLTDPNPWYAKMHFRIFTVARLFHSVAYLYPLPQPSRALGWFLGYIITLSMGVSVVRAGVM